MKKLLLLFAVLLTALRASAHDFEVDGVYYSVLSQENLTCEVTYNGQQLDKWGLPYESYSGDIVIPSTVNYNGNEFFVTAIGERAFFECPSLTSVEIPNSVTSIGEYAFYNSTRLSSVVNSNAITFIGEGAFYRCTSLKSIEIPNSTISIGSRAFSYCI